MTFRAKPYSMFRVIIIPMMPLQTAIWFFATSTLFICWIWGFLYIKNVRALTMICNYCLPSVLLVFPENVLFVSVVISQSFFSMSIIIGKGLFSIHLRMFSYISSCFGNYFITVFSVVSLSMLLFIHTLIITNP